MINRIHYDNEKLSHINVDRQQHPTFIYIYTIVSTNKILSSTRTLPFVGSVMAGAGAFSTTARNKSNIYICMCKTILPSQLSRHNNIRYTSLYNTRYIQ